MSNIDVDICGVYRWRLTAGFMVSDLRAAHEALATEPLRNQFRRIRGQYGSYYG